MDGDDEADPVNSKVNISLNRKSRLKLNGIDLDNSKPLKAITDSTFMKQHNDSEPEKPLMIRDGNFNRIHDPEDSEIPKSLPESQTRVSVTETIYSSTQKNSPLIHGKRKDDNEEDKSN